jgi:hypothetical protein
MRAIFSLINNAFAGVWWISSTELIN